MSASRSHASGTGEAEGSANGKVRDRVISDGGETCPIVTNADRRTTTRTSTVWANVCPRNPTESLPAEACPQVETRQAHKPEQSHQRKYKRRAQVRQARV